MTFKLTFRFPDKDSADEFHTEIFDGYAFTYPNGKYVWVRKISKSVIVEFHKKRHIGMLVALALCYPLDGFTLSKSEKDDS